MLSLWSFVVGWPEMAGPHSKMGVWVGVALCVHLCFKGFKNGTGGTSSVSGGGCSHLPCWDTTIYIELVKTKLGREYNTPLGEPARRKPLQKELDLRVPWAG